jgi:hypothetical protein
MWKFEHSVDCAVPRDVAWRFWTDVSNWAAIDPAVESVELDGPFAAGTAGRTKPRDMDFIAWRLADVVDGRSALVEIPAPGAVLRCVWTFEDLPAGGTRMTQRASIEGERADEYAPFGKAMEIGIPAVMERMAEAMSGER